MYDEYDDYHSLASNCDDLYCYDEQSDSNNDVTDKIEWENYYHNVAEELIDE